MAENKRAEGKRAKAKKTRAKVAVKKGIVEAKKGSGGAVKLGKRAAPGKGGTHRRADSSFFDALEGLRSKIMAAAQASERDQLARQLMDACRSCPESNGARSRAARILLEAREPLRSGERRVAMVFKAAQLDPESRHQVKSIVTEAELESPLSVESGLAVGSASAMGL